MKNLIFLLVLAAMISCAKSSSDKRDLEKEKTKSKNYSDTSSSSVPGNATKVYWGDTHLHTELSMDAGAFGNRIGLDEAYKFAKGEEVISSTGLKAKLARPLDFLVVADHSDGMGLFQAIQNSEEWVMATDQGKRWNELINSGKGAMAAIELIKAFSQKDMDMDPNDPALQKSVWGMTVEAAEKYNNPGKFTAFIGYEWTSLLAGNNLHRVVIYRDNGDKTIDQIPFTNMESSDPEDLWKVLDQYQKSTGGQVLAIPHNGNLSNGIMFAETKVNGEPFDESYVKERIKWEPLYETTQIKGDGESHPFLSPNDEFADFENWDIGNLDLSAVKTNDMLVGEYTRSALKLGLKFKNELGTNPYKFGLIGSTDSHTSLATADDNNFFGKASNVEGGAERWKHVFISSELASVITWQSVASGYAGVWATENTREALFDAMKRKETYATTGPRIQIRFFGGFNFSEADAEGDFVTKGYEKGVPMGGDIKKAGDKPPSFIAYSLMDPESGSLDRMQIVKGWLNEDGSLSEKVYDVSWSGNRTVGSDDKVPAVGSSVNLKNATWDNSIGTAELKTIWTDPDFDPNLEAFYYVRTIEIPTPRWTLYDKIKYGIEDMAEEVPLTAQQRAYTSPIWYTPE